MQDSAADYNEDLGLGAKTEAKQDDPTNPPRFHRYKMKDILNSTIPKWLIRDLLFEKQIAVMCAPSQSFKSFIALALASMLAHAMEWQGRRLKQRRVIYVAGEGFPLFGLRRRAWFKHHKLQVENDGVEVIDGAVNLLDDKDVDAFIAAMADYIGLDLTVLDTLSTCTAGEDENLSAVMTKAIENAKRIGRALNCAILIIHHPGKDLSRGARGHSSLNCNIDAEWMVERKEMDMQVSMRVTKQKDGENGQIFHFDAHKVPLGILDDDGVEICSLALTPCAPPGERISADLADRVSIAAAMEIGESLSTSGLAGRLLRPLNCKTRAAIERIGKAVSTDWMSVRRGDQVVEVRRVIGGEGKATKVEMRLANSPHLPDEVVA